MSKNEANNGIQVEHITTVERDMSANGLRCVVVRSSIVLYPCVGLGMLEVGFKVRFIRGRELWLSGQDQ